jgi:hypothetical protein
MRDITAKAKVPPLAEVPLPQPETSQPGFIARNLPRLGRLGGKLTGGALAGWHGWVAGGELGDIAGHKLQKSMAAQPVQLPPIPRTSAEYMRTMLAAKDGEISPGELARRTKLGGKDTGIRPLPEPPQ